MKRFIVGILYAFAGWIIGSQFSNLLSWTGVIVGFLLGLIFENVKETKQIAIKTWNETVSWGKNYEWDWKGTALYFGVVSLFFLTTLNWIFSTLFLGIHVEKFIKGTSNFGYFVFCILCIMCACSLISIIVLIDLGITKNFKQLTPSKVLFKELFWTQPQVLIVAGIVYSVLILYKLGKGVLILIYNIPNIFMSAIRLLARVSRFVALCLLRLISEEKKLTFAICTASGTALGLYFGREIVCGISGSVIAGILILISDKMRVWLEKKQGNCVCDT